MKKLIKHSIPFLIVVVNNEKEIPIKKKSVFTPPRHPTKKTASRRFSFLVKRIKRKLNCSSILNHSVSTTMSIAIWTASSCGSLIDRRRPLMATLGAQPPNFLST